MNNPDGVRDKSILKYESQKKKKLYNETNANLFISNNANPFLVSPYNPINTANLATKTITDEINQEIENIIGNLSSIVNLSSFSIKLSSIVTFGPASTLTVYGGITATGDLKVDGTLTLNDITINNLIANSTIYGSSIRGSEGIFSTLVTSTLGTNYLTVNNILGVSTINSLNSITNMLTVNSTLAVSTINAASSIITQDLWFSSLFSYVTSLEVAPGATFHSSLILHIGGDRYKIPLEKLP